MHLHVRPPVVPQPADPTLAVATPPADSYDFIMHVDGEIFPAVSESEGSPPVRGFGKGYEESPEELFTLVDRASTRSALLDVYDFHRSKWRPPRMPASVSQHLGGKRMTVIFLYVLPTGEPLSTEEAMEALRRIVSWVCSQEEEA
ncbi:uncharacterized protein LAESUDRAFT_765264 [Laetiporus sulphureus 93-53]|uniref:Uncharacterized protein n=1 Tax=Laetiporus sulphureus 93-53 TaxID=1314785 RepID=A0A165AUS0_9APHY|nr:uncharacterized protein LAESUDRAFT_765264 [Laetiporus sulphureus 93-53]KZS99701.1 hypothetical protein LAESUDRAFT_765264 [Laetiporus sulphureus 93-53]